MYVKGKGKKWHGCIQRKSVYKCTCRFMMIDVDVCECIWQCVCALTEVHDWNNIASQSQVLALPSHHPGRCRPDR